MLCGARGRAAIAEWGHNYNDLAPLLGFARRTRDGRRYRTPCISELHTLLAAIGAEAFEAALTRWIMAQGVADLPERVLALDGKALRGTQGHQLPRRPPAGRLLPGRRGRRRPAPRPGPDQRA